MGTDQSWDAIIIGGGFYGCIIAIYLAQQRGFKKILLIEKESQLMQRASYNNQARVHNGYHYPRSFKTAFRSRTNLPKFLQDWPNVVYKDFIKLYAVARHSSKVTAQQFVRFCNEIGASVEVANKTHQNLFESRLIENVFLVNEYAFDSSLLAIWAKNKLKKNNVETIFNSSALSITKTKDQSNNDYLQINVKNFNSILKFNAKFIFNCTYSGLNQLRGDFKGTQTRLKHEITEMAIVNVPDELKNVGVTVMDGPFFSLMPFPSKKLHSLSHVRYTPHDSWFDHPELNPYLQLDRHNRTSHFDRMIRDVSRYMPSIKNTQHIESLFEVKTILIKNETDDGRPILFEKHSELAGCYSVLGGKIDNIYDVLEKLETEDLNLMKV